MVLSVHIDFLPVDDKVLIGYAKVESMRSECERRKVGAATIANDDSLILAFNGLDCEHGDSCCHKGFGDGSEKPCNGTHAEICLLEYLEEDGLELKEGTVAVTLCPCMACAKAMIEAGVKRVLFLEDYGPNLGAKVLDEAGVTVIKVLV